MRPSATFLSCTRALLLVACLPGALLFASTENPVGAWQQQFKIARDARATEDWALVERAFASAVAYAESFPEGDPRLANTLSQWADAALEQRDYTRAIELQTRAVELHATSPHVPVQARVRELRDLGNLHKKHGEQSNAEQAFRGALALSRAAQDETAPTVGTLLSALSSTIQAQRPDDPEAIELLQRKAALEKTSRAWTEVAQYYAQREAHSEAIGSYDQAIAIERQRVVFDRARLANLLSTVARQQLLSGDTASAELAYLESLEIQESRLGPVHPGLAFTLRGLAEVYVEDQRYREAEGHLLRAEELTTAAWGETGHACSCQTRDLLLEVYRALGDEEALRAREAPEQPPDEPDPVADRIEQLDQQATEQLRALRYGDASVTILEALALREERFGPDSLQVVKGLELLGRLRWSEKDHRDAIRLYERSLEIVESHENPSAPWLAATLDRLAKSYRSMGEFDQAKPFFLRELEVRERLEQRLLAARVLEYLATTGRKQSDFVEAAKYHAEAAGLWREFAGSQAPEVLNNLTLLATDYVSLQRFDEAEALLADLLEEEEQADAHPDDLLKILRPWVGLYRKQGLGDEAAAIQRRIDRLTQLKSETRTPVEGEDH